MMQTRFSIGRMLQIVLALLLLTPEVTTLSTEAQNRSKKEVTMIDELKQLHDFSLLPEYRSGKMRMESSYDRTGGNDDGFDGTYSFIRKEGEDLVLADYKGPGVINRIWTPTPNDSMLEFYFDGEKTPRLTLKFIDLFSGKVFPFVRPVVGNEVGGYYCYLPLTFQKSCKVVYKGKKMEFYQLQYRPYPKGTKVKTFTPDLNDAEKKELQAVVDLWEKRATPDKLVDTSAYKVATEQITLTPGSEQTFFSTTRGGRIMGIELEAGTALNGFNKDVLLQAKWDDDQGYAINAPLADYFGYAFGRPSMQSIIHGSFAGTLYSYYPMPFQKKANLKLVYEKRAGIAQPQISMTARVYYLDEPQNPREEGRFYSIWRREKDTTIGEPYLLFDHQGKGHYAGIIQIAQGKRAGMTLFFEGDDVTTIDGEMTMHGTGSEDYYNGGWYAQLNRWDSGVSLPIHGSLDYALHMARTGAYRIFLSDKVSFEKSLNVTIEHGPEGNKEESDYTSVAFYYGEKPSTISMQPVADLRTIELPTRHVYFPALMDFSLGEGTTLFNDRQMKARTRGETDFRIMLPDLPEGLYRVKLTYFKNPNGCDFQIWNRQRPISQEWISSYSPNEEEVRDADLGEFYLTEHTNSVTIKLRKQEGRDLLHFDLLTLELVE